VVRRPQIEDVAPRRPGALLPPERIVEVVRVALGVERAALFRRQRDLLDRACCRVCCAISVA
jgi:hypothetical protein